MEVAGFSFAVVGIAELSLKEASQDAILPLRIQIRLTLSQIWK